MDNFENLEWEESVPAFDYSAEMKKIRKSLRKRNALIVLTSLILVAALAFGMIQYGIPALEKRYWDPNTSSFVEGVSDFEITMVVYNELFCHGQQLMSVDATKTGFAEYSLEFGFLRWKTLNSLTDNSYRSATLKQNELTFPTAFWYDFGSSYLFQNLDSPRSGWGDYNKQSLKFLNQYPKYIQVAADITFSEDISMEQLAFFSAQQSSQKARVLWAAIRCGEKGEKYLPDCGIHLHDYNVDRYAPAFWSSTDYPSLFSQKSVSESSVMEEHFKSLLKFSNDQLANGTGVVSPYGDEDFYQNALNYVEENGVKAYGCSIIATPEVLRELMKQDIVACVHISDAWVGY